MPGPLKFLYEQLSYHKILPFVCNLSMKISVHPAILVTDVLSSLAPTHTQFHHQGGSVPSETAEATLPVR